MKRESFGFRIGFLLVLIIVLAVHSAMRKGGGEGLKFYLVPDLGRAMERGIGTVITETMNQAFITLPKVFVYMPVGRVWGTLFFLFVTFASFSTVIAVFENLSASCIDNFRWERKKAVVINVFFVLIASLPCVFGFNIWENLKLIGGRSVLDSEDFLVSNILLPGGSLVYLLFRVSRWGWGYDNYIREVNTGDGPRMPEGRLMKRYPQFVLPVLIA